MTEVVETIITSSDENYGANKDPKIAVLEGKNTLNIPTKFYHKDGGEAA